MIKALLMVFVSVLFVGCGGGSIVDGIWVNDFGIIEFDSGNGTYRGLLFNGDGFDQSLSIEQEEGNLVTYSTDGKSFDAEIDGNAITITADDAREFEYSRYNGESYTEDKFKKHIDGKWIGNLMGIEMTFFIDSENSEIEIYSLGESEKGDFTINNIIGNWAVLDAGEGAVMILKDEKTFVWKGSDNENVLFTQEQ